MGGCKFPGDGMWHNDRKIEVELAVRVCDAIAVVDVGDEGDESEKVPAEVVFAKTWFEVIEGEKFEVTDKGKEVE